LELPLDLFKVYIKSVNLREVVHRQQYVIDTAMSIATTFSGKGLEEYLQLIAEQVLEN